MSSYFVIGDIHGMLNKTVRLLEWQKKYAPDHRVIFLGDAVDRGLDSKAVLELVKQEQEENNAVALLGNHETIMLDAIEDGTYEVGGVFSLWLSDGGYDTIDSFSIKDTDAPLDILHRFRGHPLVEWMKTLPYYFETDEIFCSHAPVAAVYLGCMNMRDHDFRSDKELLTWSRMKHPTIVHERRYHLDMKKVTVCGHIHAIEADVRIPRVYGQMAYVDTGSFYDGFPQSAVTVEDGELKKYIAAFDDSILIGNCEDIDYYHKWKQL